MPASIAPITSLALGGVQPTNLIEPGTKLASGGGVEGAGAGGGGFGAMLADKLGSVIELQHSSDALSQAVAAGRSDDLAGATIAVEKASIAIELVSAVRNKAIEAYQDVMRMQI